MAGILFVLMFNQVSFDMGFIPGLKAFTAAVLGGIGSITGAALGGLILGIVEAVDRFSSSLAHGIPSVRSAHHRGRFGILVLVLIFLPGGFLGLRRENGMTRSIELRLGVLRTHFESTWRWWE